jgi:hypothetical protein
MVFEDHVPVEDESTLLAQVPPAVEEDLYRLGSGEDRQPIVDGQGQEVGGVGSEEALAVAGHGLIACPIRDDGASRAGVTKLELGNQGKSALFLVTTAGLRLNAIAAIRASICACHWRVRRSRWYPAGTSQDQWPREILIALDLDAASAQWTS